MPSPIVVNIRMKPYLIQYLVNRYGQLPIEFPRKDRFGSILPRLVRKPRSDENQFENYGSETLSVVLPYSEEKNVLYHNFMPASSQKMFEDIIYKEFRVDFHDFMNDAHNNRIGITEGVMVFIDLNNLDPRSSDMLIKERQRYMEDLRKRRWRDKKKRQLTDSLVHDDT